MDNNIYSLEEFIKDVLMYNKRYLFDLVNMKIQSLIATTVGGADRPDRNAQKKMLKFVIDFRSKSGGCFLEHTNAFMIELLRDSYEALFDVNLPYSENEDSINYLLTTHETRISSETIQKITHYLYKIYRDLTVNEKYRVAHALQKSAPGEACKPTLLLLLSNFTNHADFAAAVQADICMCNDQLFVIRSDAISKRSKTSANDGAILNSAHIRHNFIYLDMLRDYKITCNEIIHHVKAADARAPVITRAPVEVVATERERTVVDKVVEAIERLDVFSTLDLSLLNVLTYTWRTISTSKVKEELIGKLVDALIDTNEMTNGHYFRLVKVLVGYKIEGNDTRYYFERNTSKTLTCSFLTSCADRLTESKDQRVISGMNDLAMLSAAGNESRIITLPVPSLETATIAINNRNAYVEFMKSTCDEIKQILYDRYEPEWMIENQYRYNSCGSSDDEDGDKDIYTDDGKYMVKAFDPLMDKLIARTVAFTVMQYSYWLN